MKRIMIRALIFLTSCLSLSSSHVAANVVEKHKLPTLQRLSVEESEQLIESLQVINRIKKMDLDTTQFLDSGRWKSIYEKGNLEIKKFHRPEVVFAGSEVSELNKFMKENTGKTVKLTTGQLDVNEPITVPNKVTLNGNGATLIANTDKVIMLDNPKQSGIENFSIRGEFTYGVYAKNGEGVLIRGIGIQGAKARPIVVMGNVRNLFMIDNTIHKNTNGGIYLRGKIVSGIIEGNIITENKGAANFSAGLLLSQIPIKNMDDPNVVHWKPVDEKMDMPMDIVIINNDIHDQQSSGIYLDGAISVHIIENRIKGNDKEGICLDNGTTGATVIGNIFEKNGGRSRQSDHELDRDFVLVHGRMEDGSAKAKLPGVSIDNAAYNILLHNTVKANYGSGIKIVRTGARNLIGQNMVIDNNLGRNDRFHFFGIELGNAVTDVPEQKDLDFVADYENIVFSNIIHGPHYAGIFLAEDVYMNDFFDNVIIGAKWSFESISNKHNNTLNNLTNIKSRGIKVSKAPLNTPEMEN
jgi:parallel beta-helix repeat protein